MPEQLGGAEFGAYAEHVAYAAKQLTRDQKRALLYPKFNAWREKWASLYGDYIEITRKDPSIRYRPKHDKALAVAQSQSYITYTRGGNRTSKTHTVFDLHQQFLTGRHSRVGLAPGQHNTFIIAGQPLNRYAPRVFEPKFLSGEKGPGSIITPIFPEDGKWFYHYDPRKYTVTIACSECAEAGRAQSCSHQKSTITLFGTENKIESLEAFTASVMHLDEDVPKSYFDAGKQRIADVPGSCIYISATPLHGPQHWYNRELERIAKGDPKKNRVIEGDMSSQKYVEVHQVSQFEAGIIPHDKIHANMKGMTPFEIQARVYGNPVSIATNPVFDHGKLADMDDKAVAPDFYTVECAEIDNKQLDVMSIRYPNEVVFTHRQTPIQDNPTGLRVWELPKDGLQYVIGVDTAKGVTDGDASCATVFEVFMKGGKPRLRMVAQWHGWLNANDYAEEIMKVAVGYNSACVGVEVTGGWGAAVVQKFKEFAYWNLYREVHDQAAAVEKADTRYGIDTTPISKPFMIQATQQYINEDYIEIPCTDTINELVAYTQRDMTKDGRKLKNPEFEGAGGSLDDRTMSVVITVAMMVGSGNVFDVLKGAVPAMAPAPHDIFEAALREEMDLNGDGWYR